MAHVISTKSGFAGAEATLRALVLHGDACGWSQLVLNPFAEAPGDPALHDLYAPAIVRGRAARGLWELPGLRRWLLRALREYRPDIVHAHLHHAGVIVASLPREPSLGRRVLSHQHGDHFRQIGSRRGEWLDRLAGARFHRVVGCSAYVERWLVEHYGYPRGRVTHVHNGWSGSPLPRPAETLPRIVCVARLRVQKNHEMLLGALAIVRRTVPEAELVLVGDGPERAVLEDQASRLGLGSAVTFMGTVDDVWPVLADARVFALASSYEPLGIAALEAMAAGLPVVATAVGGLTEVVVPGSTGYLVGRGDIEGLAERLIRLLRDPGQATTMGTAGRELAERFRAERTGAGYGRVYAELVDTRHA